MCHTFFVGTNLHHLPAIKKRKTTIPNVVFLPASVVYIPYLCCFTHASTLTHIGKQATSCI